MNKKEELKKQKQREEVKKPNDKSEETIETKQSDQSKTKESDYSQLLSEEKDKYLRLFAEFENYKKRTTKERIELFRNAGQEILIALLPVLDDFERGIKQIQQSEDKALVEGIHLIHNKLKEVLKQKGLQPMEIKEGSNFDTDFHEAITQIPAPKKKLKGKIVEIIETGYLLNEKVIRYAKVVVGE